MRALLSRTLGAAVVAVCLLGPRADLSAQGPLQARVTPASVRFPSPGVPEFEAGEVRREGIAVDVRTRGFVVWVLTIRADGPDLGGYGKPLSDLQWRQPGGEWRPISDSEQVVAFGFRSRRVDLDFRTLLRWAQDVPDRYGTGITLRVTSLFGSAGIRTAESGGVPMSGARRASVCARVGVAMGREGGASATDARRLERRCREDLPAELERLVDDELGRRATERGGP